MIYKSNLNCLSALFLIPLLLLASCDKEIINKVKSENIIKGLSFNEGSYFIYIDSTTMNYDTFTVIERNHFFYEEADNEKYEIFYYTIRSDKGKEIEFSNYVHRYGVLPENISGTIRSYPDGNIYSVSFTTLSEPFIANKETIIYTSPTVKYTTDKYIDSIYINTTLYKGVYSMHGERVRVNADELKYTSLYSVSNGLLKLKISINDTVYNNWSIVKSILL